LVNVAQLPGHSRGTTHEVLQPGHVPPPAALPPPLSDFSKILQQEAERHADKGHVTKTANFQNSRWRTAAILKIVE